VGARLLNRTTRKVTVTQDGAAFYERCLRVIADVQETENLFRQASVGPTGTIKVDVPGRVGRLIVAPALPEFLERYPHVHVHLGVTDREVNLIEEQVDCVLRVGPLSDSGLIARKMGSLPLINVASPAYLARYGMPQTPADLENHQVVRYASPTSERVAPWEWMEQDKRQVLDLPGRVTVNNAEAYIACCLSGLGLIQIPAYDVQAHLQAGELVEVLPDHRAAAMPMSLLYLHRQHLSRRFQVFADWLETLLHHSAL
jgi:DNA-binding transcriptional LysR family regulator